MSWAFYYSKYCTIAYDISIVPVNLKNSLLIKWEWEHDP